MDSGHVCYRNQGLYSALPGQVTTSYGIAMSKKFIFSIIALSIIFTVIFWMVRKDFRGDQNITQSNDDERQSAETLLAPANRGGAHDRRVSGNTEQAYSVDLINPLDSYDDFSVLKTELIGNAEQGDGRSQRILSQMYEYCFQYNLSRTYVEDVMALSEIRPDNAGEYKKIATRKQKRCQWLDEGELNPLELIEYWQARALAAGDLSAEIKDAGIRGVGASEINVLADEALVSADPDALKELANLMGRTQLPGKFSDLSGSDLDSYAWTIAACHLGKRCERNSVLLDDYCLSVGECGYASYEEMIRRAAISIDYQIVLDRKIAKIRSLLEEKK